MTRWMLDIPTRPFFNDSGFEVPQFGCMRIKTVVKEGNDTVVKTGRPDASSETIYDYTRFVFNVGTKVADQAYGRCQMWYPALAVSNSSSVAIGSSLGPVSGSFLLSSASKNPRWYVSEDDPAKSFYTSTSNRSYFVLPEKETGATFLTTSTITAKSGSSSPWTVGTGTGTLCELVVVSGTLKLQTTSVTGVDLVHLGNSSIASGRLVQCKRWMGRWLIDVDYCG